MGSLTTLLDYFADEADLEESLDLPVLGSLSWEPRFHQLHDGLQGLAPDPYLAERLYSFVRSEAPIVWVVGLGDSGEELPVAVGLAERAAQDRGLPVLLVGPERTRPRGLGTAGLRPVDGGVFAGFLEGFYPGGCGAQASGIQGVLRAWPGNDSEAQPIRPGGIFIAGRARSEGTLPGPGDVTGTVLVAPYRDQAAQVIVEEVTRLRAMGYPLLGLVAVSAPAIERRMRTSPEATETVGDVQAQDAPDQGGTMEGAAGDRGRASRADEYEPDDAAGGAMDRAGRSAGDAAEREEREGFAGPDDAEDHEEREDDENDEDGEYDGLEADDGDGRPDASADARRGAGGPFGLPGDRRATWSEDFVPGGRSGEQRAGRRMPWWAWVVLLLVLGGMAILASRLIAVESGRPQLAGPARGPAAREAAPPAAAAPDHGGVPATMDSPDGGAPATMDSPDGGAPAAMDSPDGGVPGTMDSPGEGLPATTAPKVEGPPAAVASDIGRQSPAPTSESGGASGPATGSSVAAQAGAGAASAPSAPAMGRRGAPYGLMCGSYRTAQKAQGEARRLVTAGLDARVVAVEIPGKGTWHRVVAGSWPDRAAAREAGRRALAAGWVTDAMIVSGDGYGPPIPGDWK